MQPAGQGFALERYPRRFDPVIRVFRVARIAFALGAIQREVFAVILVMGPLRCSVKYRRIEIIVARSDPFAGGFGGAGFGFTPPLRMPAKCPRIF
jgi:hypothetical protein